MTAPQEAPGTTLSKRLTITLPQASDATGVPVLEGSEESLHEIETSGGNVVKVGAV